MRARRRVFLVHGIATPPTYPMAERWGKHILPHVAGGEVVEVRPPSTGTIAGDVLRISASRAFTAEALARVGGAFSGLEPGDVVFAHSMGTVWTLELLHKSPDAFRGVHVLLCGSPCSHLILRTLLRGSGLLGGFSRGFNARRRVPHFFNRDDRVAALSEYASHPSYTLPVPIAIPDRAFEHPAEDYLAAPRMQTWMAHYLALEPIAS